MYYGPHAHLPCMSTVMREPRTSQVESSHLPLHTHAPAVLLLCGSHAPHSGCSHSRSHLPCMSPVMREPSNLTMGDPPLPAPTSPACSPCYEERGPRSTA
uniref:Uncharacterized protein n=1 Tax=Knipowitschia caucasica TaxID=637954 RepID=A0AAV2LHK3_KNICA